MQKKDLYKLILLIIALILLGVIWNFSSESIKAWRTNARSAFYEANRKSQETKPIADISSWRIYENSSRGLSFKYPNDWKINDATLYSGGIKTLTVTSPLRYDLTEYQDGAYFVMKITDMGGVGIFVYQDGYFAKYRETSAEPEVKIVGMSTEEKEFKIANQIAGTIENSSNPQGLGFRNFQNSEFGYKLYYPGTFKKETGEGINFKINVPKDYFVGTNISGAWFAVDFTEDSPETCGTDVEGPVTATSTVSKDGITWLETDSLGAAAGSSYWVTNLSTFQSLCTNVSMTVQSFNDLTTYNQDHPGAPVANYNVHRLRPIFDYLVSTIEFFQPVSRRGD